MNQAQIARDKGLEAVSSHNLRWKARAVQELGWMRRRGLINPHATFTFEGILPTLEELIGSKIPHPNLAGSIVKEAIVKGYIEKTGIWVQTEGEKKHARETRQYRWVN